MTTRTLTRRLADLEARAGNGTATPWEQFVVESDAEELQARELARAGGVNAVIRRIVDAGAKVEA